MRFTALMFVFGSLVAGCSKEQSKPDPAKAPAATAPAATATGSAPAAAAAESDAAKTAGVEPGGIEHKGEGPSAQITAVSGGVEVRRVGEATFAAAKAKTDLFPGDTVRTGEKATATVALADTTVIELAEVSTVAIASRDGTADPASSAAVLGGLARFTVAKRSPGEGAFRVYTPAGVVITTGTVYGIGVSASGTARVGVESGSVLALGLADLGAVGTKVDGGSSVVLEANGTIAQPSPWPQDDWGTWRDESDASVDLAATIDAHSAALASLQAQLDAAYAELQITANKVASFEASAAGWEQANDSAAYKAGLPEASADIDASFALGGRIEALTWANAGRGQLAADLYVRHPDVVRPRWQSVAPRVDASFLWPKRFEVTAVGYFEPLRAAYYVHHPRGRVHAPLVGITVPTFYAQVEPPALGPTVVRTRVKGPVWQLPELEYHAEAAARPVWIETPEPSWRSTRFTVAPPRSKVAWYVRPTTPRAKVLVGIDVRSAFDSRLAVRPPEPRASLRARWTIPVGVRIKLGAPDLRAAATARGNWRIGTPAVAAGVRVKAGVRVPAPPPPPDVRGGVDVRVKVAVPAPPPPPRIEVRAPSVRVKAGVGVGAGAGTGGGRAAVSGGAKVRVKVPSVKVVVPKPPKVRIKAGVKVKAGFGF